MGEPSIETQGGAIVEGDVQAGTFVGRDQIIVLSDYTGEQLDLVLGRLQSILSQGRADLRADLARPRLTVTAPDGPRIVLSADAASALSLAATRQASEKAYLTALLVNPRFGRWASQFVPLAGTLMSLECPPGWADIPPEFTSLVVVGEGPERRIHRERLEDITVATERHKTLVLLGEPGSGKTTVLHKLALDAARQRLTTGQGPLPLYLPLADYRDHASPHAYVDAVWRQVRGGGLGDLLRSGQMLLLCDALNEMPSADARDYRAKVGAWRRFVDEWPRNQAVFTCRSRDYSEPMGMHQVEIERLDDARVHEFVAKYLQPPLAQEAWVRLAGSPLLELVRNPYYLCMLTYILSRDGEWPENRATLFDGFARTLLGRERQRHHPDWPGERTLSAGLSVLAYRVQALGEGTRLPRSRAAGMIPSRLPGPQGMVEVSPEAILRLGLAATLLDAESAPGAEERVRFYHHQLQEYFAAHEMVSRYQAGEALGALWTVPRLARKMPDPGPLGDNEPLPPPPTLGWEEPTVLAAALVSDPASFVAAVRAVNPVLAARCLVEAGIGPLPRVAGGVRGDLLSEIADRRVHIRARIAAGEALGRLGDPRFAEVQAGVHRVLIPPLVRVPGGPYQMGSSRGHLLRLRLKGFSYASDELPRHTVSVPAFLIGQFPVTRAEYACFVDAGGYGQERFWRTEDARAWRRGERSEEGPVSELMDIWRAIRADPSVLQRMRRSGVSPAAISTWEQLGGVEENEVRAILTRGYAERPRDRPAYWGDERYDRPSQPVVGVTWYEACAYCRWLEEQLDAVPCTLKVHREGRAEALNVEGGAFSVRLPSEAEWERAARGPRGTVYPWGNRWQSRRANTWEGHALRPTPVGIYPDGATPEGAHDMAGNVWEWTTSLYRPYPYDARDGREDLSVDGRRMVRGGSWLFTSFDARCTIRNRIIPGVWCDDVGFRVVFSPRSGPRSVAQGEALSSSDC